MYLETLGKRIKYHRLRIGLNQKELAEKLHIAKSTMSQYESDNRTPSDEVKRELCDLFHITLDELMGHHIKPESRNGTAIPVFGRVAVGTSVDVIQEVVGWEELPKAMAAKSEYFALKMKGDYMFPTIPEGSTVIVRKQNSVENNEIAVVQINGDEETTIKRVLIQAQGLTLINDNALNYPPHYYSNIELESLPVRIIGKVIEVRTMV